MNGKNYNMEIIVDILFVGDLLFISLVDYKKYIIPNSLNLGILFLKTIKILLFGSNFEDSIIGMGVYPIILLIIYGYVSDFFGKELMGFGDIKLVASIGFYNGYTSIFQVMIFYNIISVVGILIYIIMLKFSKEKDLRDRKLPFSPIVILSYFIFKISENIL